MASKKDKRDLFDFMLKRIGETQRRTGLAEPQAFGRWFLDMYFRNPQDVFVSDGSRDGKVDVFFTTHNARTVEHHIINSKFTREYNKTAPAVFYHEITYFWRVFDNQSSREEHLEEAVKPELRPRYRQLFERYDAGAAKLMFVTNHSRNDSHYGQVKDLPVKIFHLDDLIQYLIDDIDGAMPRTPDICLTGIQIPLSPDRSDTEVPTSIVFARLIDFVRYMESDPYDLLFSRNVRVAISPGRSRVNKEIRETFEKEPKEFAFSNNGITMLCDRQVFDPGSKELVLQNPRVVNGSQTLHSIRDVPNPSPSARVMVRIIEIPRGTNGDISEYAEQRKEVVRKIAVRSNQQNPIKKWDLVSNDDFQLELYRYFRQKRLFYERRQGEWTQRNRELRSVGVSRGIGIKKMAQLIASYYWNKKKLGPANAKQEAGELFGGETYDLICQTPIELAYQIYLVNDDLEGAFWDLAGSKKYIAYLKGHINLTLLAVAAKALKAAGADWGKEEFTHLLEEQQKVWWGWGGYMVPWRRLTKACVDHIVAFYEKEARAIRKAEGYEPTYSNYFKNQSYIAKILAAPIPGKLVKLARVVALPK